MKSRHFLLFLALIGYTYPAFSGVYKQVDEHGNTTYSNIRSNSAEKVDLPPIIMVPSADPNGIDDRIMQRRENKIIREQRGELERRIAEESSQLEEIKSEYKDGNPDRLGSERNYQRYLNRVERLKNEISVREANLQALQHQLDDLPQIK